MKRPFIRIVSIILTLTMTFGIFAVRSSAAQSISQLQNTINQLEKQSKALEAEIAKLKSQKNQQEALKTAIQQKIANTQQQINACNAEIGRINSVIAANQKEIDQKNAEIEADKLAFKKRIRAIYMSSAKSNVQVLLGSENFSEYLQLSQLTAAVSARDKFVIEKIVAAVETLEKKKAENKALLESQVEIRKTIMQKQQELQNQNAQIQSVINEINADKKDLENENASIEKQIKDYQATIRAQSSTGGTSFVYDGGAFLWPVPGYYNISAGFMSNDSVHNGRHYGIDIAGGGIAGKPIVAIADGIITKSNNSCTHNYGKSGSCGCGGGYGNYVTINHGTGPDGNTYVVTYGHMSHAAVTSGTVKKGQVIGYVGTTGWSTGYHLHFGISVNGNWVNPMKYYTKTTP